MREWLTACGKQTARRRALEAPRAPCPPEYPRSSPAQPEWSSSGGQTRTTRAPEPAPQRQTTTRRWWWQSCRTRSSPPRTRRSWGSGPGWARPPAWLPRTRRGGGGGAGEGACTRRCGADGTGDGSVRTSRCWPRSRTRRPRGGLAMLSAPRSPNF